MYLVVLEPASNSAWEAAISVNVIVPDPLVTGTVFAAPSATQDKAPVLPFKDSSTEVAE